MSILGGRRLVCWTFFENIVLKYDEPSQSLQKIFYRKLSVFFKDKRRATSSGVKLRFVERSRGLMARGLVVRSFAS